MTRTIDNEKHKSVTSTMNIQMEQWWVQFNNYVQVSKSLLAAPISLNVFIAKRGFEGISLSSFIYVQRVY